MSDTTSSTALVEAAPVARASSAVMLQDPARFHQLMAVAEMMATGMATVPKHLQKNKGDCLAICIQASLWNMNPFAVGQKTHVVQGTLGYEAQLVNAAVTSIAPTKDRINYEWFGDWNQVMGKFKEVTSKSKKDEDTGEFKTYRVPAWNINDEKGLGIRVSATMKGEDKPRVLELLLVQARVRNSTLWADDPRQQLAYLAVKRWTRLHCPDVLLGVYTPDELEEFSPPKHMGEAEVLPPQTPAVPDALLAAAREAAEKGRAAFGDWWKAATPPERTLLQFELADLQTRTAAADESRTVDNAAPAATAKTAAANTPAPSPAPADAAAAAPAAEAKAATGAPVPTAASIEDKMLKAKTKSALDIAADWIKDLPEAADKKRLNDLYDKLVKDLAEKK